MKGGGGGPITLTRGRWFCYPKYYALLSLRWGSLTNLVPGKSSSSSSSDDDDSVVRAYTRGSLPSVTSSQSHKAARRATTSQTHLAYESSAS